MKSISISYSESGLNSNRLILDAVVNILDSADESGIVEISPENHLEDIQQLLEKHFRTNAGIMTSKNLRTGKTSHYLQAFVS